MRCLIWLGGLLWICGTATASESEQKDNKDADAIRVTESEEKKAKKPKDTKSRERLVPREASFTIVGEDAPGGQLFIAFEGLQRDLIACAHEASKKALIAGKSPKTLDQEKVYTDCLCSQADTKTFKDRVKTVFGELKKHPQFKGKALEFMHSKNSLYVSSVVLKTELFEPKSIEEKCGS